MVCQSGLTSDWLGAGCGSHSGMARSSFRRRVTAGRTDACADGEPKSVAAKAPPEAAALRGGDGGVAFAGERNDFGCVVVGILLRGGELRVTGTAVLDKIVEGFEVGGGNLGDGGRGEILRCDSGGRRGRLWGRGSRLRR